MKDLSENKKGRKRNAEDDDMDDTEESKGFRKRLKGGNGGKFNKNSNKKGNKKRNK